jgi:hypothetical protein
VGHAFIASLSDGADTIASPAISRSDIFVSTASSLRSYDVKSLALISEFD